VGFLMRDTAQLQSVGWVGTVEWVIHTHMHRNISHLGVPISSPGAANGGNTSQWINCSLVNEYKEGKM
jgi:hypothetical protein